MAPIEVSVEIGRTPDDVFAYVTDPSNFPEWQAGVVGGYMDPDSGTGVGAKCVTVRRIGGAERHVTAEVVKLDPPRAWAAHGVDGPIRADVDVAVEPLDGGAGSRLSIRLGFEGHGVGRLLVPLVVRPRARRRMPANLERLKTRIETRPR